MNRKVKLIYLLALWVLGINHAQAQQTGQQEQKKGLFFTLNGTIENSERSYLYLLYEDWQDNEVLDSSRITDGKFKFTGRIVEPSRALLRANPKTIPDATNLNIVGIYLEAGAIEVKVVYNLFDSIRVTGSTTQQDVDRYNSLSVPHRKAYLSTQKLVENYKQEGRSQKEIDSLETLSARAVNGMRSVSRQFIRNNPNSYFSVEELSGWRNLWPSDTVRNLFSGMSPQIKQSKKGQKIAKLIKDLDSAAVGTIAYNFSGTELNGEAIKLSDLKGRYVLLDFWGSWCAPCRIGNPHLIELYDKYRDKGIEFIGIASQDKELPWRNAVKKDSIGIWKNIMDTSQAERGLAIAHKYAVHSFPTKILVDKRGKILGRYKGADGKKLEEDLEKFLK